MQIFRKGSFCDGKLGGMLSIPWDRDAVAYCSCAALRYVHVHCPCQNCNGKAVARSNKLQHRKAAKLISNFYTHARVEDINDMEDTNDDDIKDTNDDDIEDTNDDDIEDTNYNDMEDMDMNDNNMEGVIDNDTSLEDNTQMNTCSLTCSDSSHSGSDHVSSSPEAQTNATVNRSANLQNDILIAVLRTFELMEEANASQKGFMNILNFGRDMYCKNDPNVIKNGQVLGQHA